MIRKRIFLASSKELAEDRSQFEIMLGRKNKVLTNSGIFIELVIWEDFLDAMSKTRLQDEYNKAIEESDMFVMLFATKVGPYTEEEFDTAVKTFQATDKPVIYVYFKDAAITTGTAVEEDLQSMWSFLRKVKKLGHFCSPYKNIDALKLHFDRQLEMWLRPLYETKDGSVSDQMHKLRKKFNKAVDKKKPAKSGRNSK